MSNTPGRDWTQSNYCSCGATLNNEGKCPRCGGAGIGKQTPSYGGRDYSQDHGRTTPNFDNK